MNKLTHFESLRKMINDQLLKIGAPYATKQSNEYPWLYGALGMVPSEIMFVCENPSLSSVERANLQTIDNREPDIEAQWWGGPRNPAATRFRRVLYELGLKTSPPQERGGWRCYITNALKEANFVHEQRTLSTTKQTAQWRDWAEVLQWELEQVRPSIVFAVGGPAANALRHMQKAGIIEEFKYHKIYHYSARGTNDAIVQKMRNGICEPTGPRRRA